jgi:DNA modification methylase
MSTNLDKTLSRVHVGKAIELFDGLPENSVDMVFTDPPYTEPDEDVERSEYWGIDKCEGGYTEAKGLKNLPRYKQSLAAQRSYQVWTEAWARAAIRVLKPGGYLLSFCSNEAYHRLACGIEDAGLEVRDKWEYAYAKGMPTGQRKIWKDIEKVDPELAAALDGDRNIVLPANEPICVARKPLQGTYAENAVAWGISGGFNVDGNLNGLGRQPSSLIAFDEEIFGDYTKFFFCPKATKDDKELPGIYVLSEDTPSHIVSWMTRKVEREFFFEDELHLTKREWFIPLINDHDTIKNAANCERIVARIARPGALVVDPFAGSGSLLAGAVRRGCRVIGGDISALSARIANARLYLESVK